MGRVFRNEGLSRRHNPEFTMIELCQAYGDFHTMMELIRSMVQRLCRNVIGAMDIEQSNATSLRRPMA
jgi:lysyl-tRNA synthetase class 2